MILLFIIGFRLPSKNSYEIQWATYHVNTLFRITWGTWVDLPQAVWPTRTRQCCCSSLKNRTKSRSQLHTGKVLLLLLLLVFWWERRRAAAALSWLLVGSEAKRWRGSRAICGGGLERAFLCAVGIAQGASCVNFETILK